MRRTFKFKQHRQQIAVCLKDFGFFFALFTVLFQRKIPKLAHATIPPPTGENDENQKDEVKQNKKKIEKNSQTLGHTQTHIQNNHTRIYYANHIESTVLFGRCLLRRSSKTILPTFGRKKNIFRLQSLSIYFVCLVVQKHKSARLFCDLKKKAHSTTKH